MSDQPKRPATPDSRYYNEHVERTAQKEKHFDLWKQLRALEQEAIKSGFDTPIETLNTIARLRAQLLGVERDMGKH